MWTVRNNLKGALKFTDIFIGGKPIILKSRGFLDLDLIDGGRKAAEMSEQLKRCYDEAYIRDIHRTNTPEEMVQMNLRDLENIAQRTEIEELKIKLKDGGSKMDQILEAISQKSELPGNANDLMTLRDQLESVIEQIQNASTSDQPEVTEDEKQISVTDYNKALEESNQQLRDLLKSQDQKIDNLGKLLQNQHKAPSPQSQSSEIFSSLFEAQTKRLDALMEKLQNQQTEKEKSKSKTKLEESEFDFNGDFVAFDNSLPEIKKQLQQIEEIKSLLEQQKEQVYDVIDTPDQILQQKKQLQDLMNMIQKKEASILTKDELTELMQQNPEIGKQDQVLNDKLNQITQLLMDRENQEATNSSVTTQSLEKQLEQQKEQIDQLTSLLTQKNSQQNNGNSALEQQMAQQQEQIKQLTELLLHQQTQATPTPETSVPNQELMQKNLALQNEQLLNISNTIQELKQKDDVRHEDMIDLKVLMSQHQSGNAFSRVVKTLSATDIAAALKVSDQIDDHIKDNQFQVTKKSKQKVDHPDVSELLGNTDLDFD